MGYKLIALEKEEAIVPGGNIGEKTYFKTVLMEWGAGGKITREMNLLQH